MKVEEISKISKSLGEPKRIEIINLTSKKEMCANHILKKFEITQPTLSHHMKQLTECNLINVRKDGKMSYYSLNKDTLNEYLEFFNEIK
ncbi:ArsR/SmtB family transcription factor [Methanosphaera sp.]|uniref:ArsR/SmtB family transcription factor n=1 Tax=Methanosphaera sp. TaxID=2666342 RepID=UPI002E7689FD|nr:metalloregulator ArsR/SmtB family transcription factor [Methanosphaera sp.]MEE1117892.1 metalloregulator ArsR/SmtB family transcription factor [Methanosphaera sp.]